MIVIHITEPSAHEAGAIGIIGGADGPTAIYVAEAASQGRNEWLRRVDEAAKEITANGHSLSELESHLQERYSAVPCTLSPSQLKCIQVNVMLNYFSHLLSPMPPLPENPSKKELLAYAQADKRFEDARSYPAEQLNLEIAAYRIPDKNNTLVELERTTGYFTIQNASKAFCDAITLWLGVTREDIDSRSPRFLAYLQLLWDKETDKHQGEN